MASVLAPGEFICVGGTDSKAILCTSNGTMLSTLASRNGWVWCVRGHPKKNCIAVGSEDGSIAVYQLLFSTVHGLYNDRYAFRYSTKCDVFPAGSTCLCRQSQTPKPP